MSAGRKPVGQLTKSGILSISIPSLPELEAIPGQLVAAERRFMRFLGVALVDDIAKTAPRRTGTLARSFTYHRLSDTSLIVGSLQGPGRLYARAIDRGSYRRVDGQGLHVDGKPRALRWRTSGGYAFARFVRLKPNPFFERSLRRRTRIGARVYEEAFGNIEHGGAL